jgi:hypothetical protein
MPCPVRAQNVLKLADYRSLRYPIAILIIRGEYEAYLSTHAKHYGHFKIKKMQYSHLFE